jgi:exosortase A-associated hydrolase 1
VDCLQSAVPVVRRVLLWGLCDAATAIAVYAGSDPRVAALVLANPWVYSAEGAARVRLRHYYLRRLASGDFWRKLARGGVRPVAALRGLLRSGLQARGKPANAGMPPDGAQAVETRDLAGSLSRGLRHFDGEVLLLLSGADYTAAQFELAAREHAALEGALRDARVVRQRLADADHTFSRPAHRQQVEAHSLQFLLGLRVEDARGDEARDGATAPR